MCAKLVSFPSSESVGCKNMYGVFVTTYPILYNTIKFTIITMFTITFSVGKGFLN